jgi:hypothetical protein
MSNRVDWVYFGHTVHIFTIIKNPKPHWKQAVPAMNFFFSVSINEILIFVFDTHWTLFEGKGAA